MIFFGCCEVQNRFVLRRFIVVDFMGMRFREFFEVPNFSYVSKLLLERLERKSKLIWRIVINNSECS